MGTLPLAGLSRLLHLGWEVIIEGETAAAAASTLMTPWQLLAQQSMCALHIFLKLSCLLCHTLPLRISYNMNYSSFYF